MYSGLEVDDVEAAGIGLWRWVGAVVLEEHLCQSELQKMRMEGLFTRELSVFKEKRRVNANHCVRLTYQDF